MPHFDSFLVKDLVISVKKSNFAYECIYNYDLNEPTITINL